MAFLARRLFQKASCGFSFSTITKSPALLQKAPALLQKALFQKAPALLQKGSRSFSTTSKTPALLLGLKGVISYSDDEFEELDLFTSRSPLLEPIPTNRLYGRVYDPSRPYGITDSIRLFVRTGAITVSNAKALGVSLVNPFQPGNVGVLKGLGYMAFKRLEIDPEHSWKNHGYSLGYHQLRQFLLDRIFEMHGGSALSMLPKQFESYLEDLNVQQVIEDHAVEHPALLPDLIYGDTCVELCRATLRERVLNKPPTAKKSQGQGPFPIPSPPPPGLGPSPPSYLHKTQLDRLIFFSHSKVLIDIGASQLSALKDCLTHEILLLFLPHFEKKKCDPTNWPFTSPLTPIASTLLDCAFICIEICRHATVHAEEDHVVDRVIQQKLYSKYSRADLVQVVRYVYPDILRTAYEPLDKIGEWGRLRIAERFPRPSLYNAPSNAPYTEAKSDTL